MAPSRSEGVFRVGLIGYGLAGASFHAPLLSVEPAFHLSAIATRSVEAVARDWPGVRVVTVDALMADPELDLIIVATPTDTHASLAERALLAGKHVVVEKPFTLSAAEAERLGALAKERGRCLAVFQNRRWDGDFLTVKRLVEQGRLGKLYSFESHFDRYRPQVKKRWKEEAGPGGGTLWDLGAHLVDQALQLFGKPDSILADAGKQRPGAQAVDWFLLVLLYGEMRVILRSGSVVHEPTPRFVLHGEADAYTKYGLDPQEEQLKAGLRPGMAGWGTEPPERQGQLSRGGSVPTETGRYEHFYRQLAAAMAGQGEVPVTAESAAQVIRVLEVANQKGESRELLHT